MKKAMLSGLAFILFMVLLISVTVSAYTLYHYDEDGLPLVGAKTLTTGTKIDSSVETADQSPGLCAVTFKSWLERRANGLSGDWVTNSTTYYTYSSTPLVMYYQNVTANSATRLRGSRYNLQSGRIQGDIYFY